MPSLKYRVPIFILGWILSTLACVRVQPEVIIITATFPPPVSEFPIEREITPTARSMSETPTADLTPQTTPNDQITASYQEYVIQPNDTLSSIAAQNNTTVAAIIRLNELDNPNVLYVGQLIRLPAPPSELTPANIVLPNTRFVRSPYSVGFDTYAFVDALPGFIASASDQVSVSNALGVRRDVTMSGAEIIERVAVDYSIDPRLLLALLEYKSGWLTNPTPSAEAVIYPMGFIDESRQGLYKQLSWAANQLNRAYYGWRYRGLQTLEFADGERLAFAPNLNGATVAVQHLLSLNNTYNVWSQQLAGSGLNQTYQFLFGDPFTDLEDDYLSGADTQPDLLLPFARDEVWFFTGGPHGGWGSGSAWAALDIAPPDDRQPGDALCYVSDYPVRAVADGVIARSESGALVLDLDMDGNEATGWTILYLHLASTERLTKGATVEAGDPVGYPSCEGGFSNATHLHIARRYNGEWIPATCHQCRNMLLPPFTLGGWRSAGFENQEYQGLMLRDGDQRRAEQGRLTPENRLAW